MRPGIDAGESYVREVAAYLLVRSLQRGRLLLKGSGSEYDDVVVVVVVVVVVLGAVAPSCLCRGEAVERILCEGSRSKVRKTRGKPFWLVPILLR